MRSGFIKYPLAIISFVAFISLVCVLPSEAQLSQPARFEKEQPGRDRNFTVVSMNEQGVALINEEDKYENGNIFFEIILLDSLLQETWTTEVNLKNHFRLIGYEYAAKELYVLFRNGDHNQGGLHLIKINIYSHEITPYEIEPKLDFMLSYFTVVGQTAVLGGYINRQSAVFLYEMTNRQSKVVPGFFISENEFLDLRANRNNTFNALLMQRNTTGKKLILKTFDDTGALIVEDAFEIDADKAVLSGITSSLERDELLLTGTWGKVNGKMALGVYTVVVDPTDKHTIQYYDFSELEHFFDYLSPRKEQKIKAKAKRRREKGKQPTHTVHVNICKLEETPKGFILLSEVYTPFANGSPYNPYSGWNSYNSFYSPYGYGYNPYGYNSYANPYANPYGPYSSGYNRRTDVTVMHSSIVVFDAMGKIKEDAALKFISEQKLPNLEQVSDFCDTGQKIYQVYKKEKEIHFSTRLPDGSGLEEGAEKIQLKSPTDLLRKDADQSGNVRRWFGHYLFVWGYEDIKEKDGFGDPVRSVFYINKLKVE